MNEDKAARYHRLKRRTGLLSLAWSVLLLGGLLLTGASVSLREFGTTLAHAVVPPAAAPSVVVVVYVVLLTLINEVGSLPLGFYSGFVIERRYGLSNQPLRGWLADQVKSLGLGLLVGALAATIVYFFARHWGGDWWLPTGVVFAVCFVGLARVGPVLLLPLFYSVTPIERESLNVRLLSLADRAGARVLGAYEWGLSKQTKKANAALAGLGRTRRILVSDTMLAEYSDEEIEVVMAHEMAHHVHGDIWKGLVFESVLVIAGFFAASRALHVGVERLGLQSEADVAGVPLLLLVAGAVSFAMLPAAHAMSRAHERSADRFALNLTRNPAAFVSAMKRLGAQNLAEEHPSKIVEWLFYSHPPIRERILAAEQFRG